jgi:hypothetical protein
MVSISLVPGLALLCFYVSTFRSMCAVPNMAVFCSSLTSWFPGMLLIYFLNDLEKLLLLLLYSALIKSAGIAPVPDCFYLLNFQSPRAQRSCVQALVCQAYVFQFIL